jgi:hypothetical protein
VDQRHHSVLDELGSYGWGFRNGRVASVHITRSLAFSRIETDLDYLMQTYGEPTLLETQPYQNAYGRIGICTRRAWNMPDGVVITALEARNVALGLHCLEIGFETGESVREREAKRVNRETNPYK